MGRTNTQLKTLAFSASPKITGDIKSLSGFTALTHIDFAASSLLRGSMDDLTALGLTYINLHSAQRIGGDLHKLPKTLVYANFNAALRFTGTVDQIGTGAVPSNDCALKELDLGSASGKILGSLALAAANSGLFKRCANLVYADLGSVYGTDPAKQVVKGAFTFGATECVKANGLATKGCQ